MHERRATRRAYDTRCARRRHHRVLLRDVDGRSATPAHQAYCPLASVARDALQHTGNSRSHSRYETGRFLRETTEKGEEAGVSLHPATLAHVEVSHVVAHCVPPIPFRRARLLSLIAAWRSVSLVC